jgi:hypothetical protein
MTNSRRGQLADLELRHPRRARAEDRIRCAKDSGLANLPLHDFAQNQIWCAIVALAADLPAWLQTLALTKHPARRWGPKGCAYGCSPSPEVWQPPAADAGCTWPPPRRSPAWPSTRSGGWTPWPLPAEHPGPVPTIRGTGRPVDPAPTRATRANRHTPKPESRPGGTRTPTTDHTIMIEKDPG